MIPRSIPGLLLVSVATLATVQPASAADYEATVLTDGPKAYVGDADQAAFYDFTTRTELSFSPVLNPPNTQPFTIEAWLYPASDQTGNGQSPGPIRHPTPNRRPARRSSTSSIEHFRGAGSTHRAETKRAKEAGGPASLLFRNRSRMMQGYGSGNVGATVAALVATGAGR